MPGLASLVGMECRVNRSSSIPLLVCISCQSAEPYRGHAYKEPCISPSIQFSTR
ncbi:hypothetical protein RSAG8_02922, partial [Rhizoctonia solani AG-8 WAC10335]